MTILRILAVIVFFVMLSFLFWLPPIDLKSEFKPYDGIMGPIPLPVNHAKLLELEHNKTIMEIQKRKDEINLWFRYKFILIGSLLAGVFLHLNLGSTRPNTESPRERLSNIMKSPVAAFLLAIAIVISFSIDMHIRKHHIVVYQLGLWINYYVEPAFLLSWSDNENSPTSTGSQGNKKDQQSLLSNKNQYKKMKGWEQFLRIKKEGKSGKELSGMNVSKIYNLAHWVPVNSLTILLFLLYVVIMQNVVSNQMDAKIKSITFTGLAFLHLDIILFSVQSHLIPSTFEFVGFIPERQLKYIFPTLAILLAVLNFSHLIIIQKYSR